MLQGKMSEIEIECPFCNKGKIKVFRKESFARPRFSRISGGKKATRYERVPTKYIVTEGCLFCGKTKKEIEKAFDTGKTKEMTHEERIERFKKRGLPLVIDSKKSENV